MSEFISMATHLDTDPERVNVIVQVVIDYFDGADADLLRQRLKTELGTISSSEFAYAAQLFADGQATEDDVPFKQEHELLIHAIFDEVLGIAVAGELPPGHPVHTFLQENAAINILVNQMRVQLEKAFDADWWTEAYGRLAQVNTHYVRKENQLFPFLERKGFDRPSTVMWAVHDDIRTAIKGSRELLAIGEVDAFLREQDAVLAAVADMTFKEEKILLPTSLDLLSDADWAEIRRGEEEVGYCLIDPPPNWSPDAVPTPQRMAESASATPAKPRARRFTTPKKRPSTQVGAISLDGGFVTPEQINLLLKKLPVDVTFVDEWDQVKFYNRGDERVFPRSPGIIDREVRYCHPPKSVHVVVEIVNKFKSGARDTAEFWIQMHGRFIHIRYFAVRDAEGNYKGVLEVSQDVTHQRTITPAEPQENTQLWASKKEGFEILDAREADPGKFFPVVSAKATALPEGAGLHIIQSFEPAPLYGVLGSMGFTYETVQTDGDFHVYFYKTPTAPSAEAIADNPATQAEAKPFTPPAHKPSATVGAIGLEEGYLTSEQISLMLQYLPLDIAFVNEYDEVKYVNHGGKTAVNNETTIASFKAGAEDAVEHWDWGQENGRFLHKNTIAIRDADGNYKGVLAVTQDITAIRALEGEQRILDWQ